MSCGACSKRRAAKDSARGTYDVMNGQSYISNSQLKARLGVFKKKYCKECSKRYDCTYDVYVNCKIKQV